jgi:hypothetical protein
MPRRSTSAAATHWKPRSLILKGWGAQTDWSEHHDAQNSDWFGGRSDCHGWGDAECLGRAAGETSSGEASSNIGILPSRETSSGEISSDVGIPPAREASSGEISSNLRIPPAREASSGEVSSDVRIPPSREASSGEISSDAGIPPSREASSNIGIPTWARETSPREASSGEASLADKTAPHLRAYVRRVYGRH